MEQVVARAGFGDGGAKLSDLSGGQHHGHGLDVVPGGPVLHPSHPAGIGGDIASQCGQLFSGIGGIKTSVGQSVLRQLLEQNPGLDCDREIFQVISQNPVHAGGAEDHASKNRDAAAHQPCASAPGGDGDVVCIAEFHHRRSLFRGENFHGSLGGMDPVDGHFIPTVVGIDLTAGSDPAGDNGFQLCQELLGDRLIGSHNGQPPFACMGGPVPDPMKI